MISTARLESLLSVCCCCCCLLCTDILRRDSPSFPQLGKEEEEEDDLLIIRLRRAMVYYCYSAAPATAVHLIRIIMKLVQLSHEPQMSPIIIIIVVVIVRRCGDAGKEGAVLVIQASFGTTSLVVELCTQGII